ncbi:uncharacterized protein LOC121007708 isoform X3 [Bufo bufo]|uniref:uncharacterized protein LOC121007708 isoform X3 n=1 Tax=Bufo bufo TaxID=8384 RepID=UPI001ABE6749|nr:uncharacterized protein LOC121007708 isoform X3 [Bufo bufo]XP_040295770.1 uncharacterized protein LOC121007708 isoform X3 [Bufo bufo]
MSSDSPPSIPPRRRMRIQRISSSLNEEFVTSPSREPQNTPPWGCGSDRDPGRQEDIEAGVAGGDPRAASTVRRGACGGRGRGSRVSTSEGEEEVMLHLDNDFLIQLVEARHTLWDHTNCRHSDHQHTQRLWEEDSAALFLTWEDLSGEARSQCQLQAALGSLKSSQKRSLNWPPPQAPLSMPLPRTLLVPYHFPQLKPPGSRLTPLPGHFWLVRGPVGAVGGI